MRVRLLTNVHFGLICTCNLFHCAALRRLVRSKQQSARAATSFDSRGAVTAPQVFSREPRRGDLMEALPDDEVGAGIRDFAAPVDLISLVVA